MTKFIILTRDSVSPYVFEADFNMASNKIHAIGGGQAGGEAIEHLPDPLAGQGGKGGFYAVRNNAAYSPGTSVSFTVGSGGSDAYGRIGDTGGDTYFGVALLAPGGGSPSTPIGDGFFAGGDGKLSSVLSGVGGGAAGPYADGETSPNFLHGGAGDGGLGGAGGTVNADGKNGSEWIGGAFNVGSGGGGGRAVGQNGAHGGLYGGGGSGGAWLATTPTPTLFGSGPGADGVIVIEYEPIV